MSGPLICRSIRGRPDWTLLFPALLQGNGIRWKGTVAAMARPLGDPFPRSIDLKNRD